MNIKGMKPRVRQAYSFLREQAKKQGKNICDLYEKKALVEYVNICDWDWSVHDEIAHGKTEEEALEATHEWFMKMSNEELFFDRISSHSQYELILLKAEELGFEPKEEV